MNLDICNAKGFIPMYNDPTLPQQAPYGQPQSPYGQSLYGQPQSPYGQSPVFSPIAPQQPKKSRRNLWIILSVIVLVVGAGIFALVYFLNHNGATDAVNTSSKNQDYLTAYQYYAAIKNQDYAIAYQYLDPNLRTNQGGQPVTQDVFIQTGQLVDTEKGPVTNYSITSTSLSSTNGGNTEDFTVNVTRNGTSYDVHLQLRQEGNDWKIVSFDTI